MRVLCRRCLLVVGVPAILVTLTGLSRSAVMLILVPKTRSLSRKVMLSFWGSYWDGRTLSTTPMDRMHLMSTWSPGMMALAGIRIMTIASICFLFIWLLIGVFCWACACWRHHVLLAPGTPLSVWQSSECSA